MSKTDKDKFVPLREQAEYKNSANNMADKPETEVKLFELQDKWLQTRDEQTWSDMLSLVYSYTRSMVLKRLTGKKFLQPDEVDDAAVTATFSFMSQYLKPNKYGKQFEVGASFAGLIKFKIMEALYKDNIEDNHLSLNSLVGDDKRTELGDTLNYKNLGLSEEYDSVDDPEANLMKSDVKEEISELLEEFDSEVQDDYIRVVARLYLVLCLKRPRSRHSKECFIKQWAQDSKCRQAIDLLMLELHKRMNVYSAA